jgi:hypothetical protein
VSCLVGGTRFELVASSVSGKRSPAELTARELARGHGFHVRPWTPRSSPRDYQIDYSPPGRTGIPAVTGWGSCFTADRTPGGPGVSDISSAGNGTVSGAYGKTCRQDVLRRVAVPLVPGTTGRALPRPGVQAQRREQMPARRAGFIAVGVGDGRQRRHGAAKTARRGRAWRSVASVRTTLISSSRWSRPLKAPAHLNKLTGLRACGAGPIAIGAERPPIEGGTQARLPVNEGRRPSQPGLVTAPSTRPGYRAEERRRWDSGL